MTAAYELVSANSLRGNILPTTRADSSESSLLLWKCLAIFVPFDPSPSKEEIADNF
jgi:hypothetical protein